MQPSLNLEGWVPQALGTFEVPGASFAVVKDDRILWEGGFGVRQIGRPEPVDEHSLYAIASISKSTVPLCLGMLVDEGRLGWDDRVTDHLPYFRLYDLFAWQEMRVRDLLTHVSGLPEVSGGTIWYGSDFSREEVVRRLRFLKPSAGFRTQYAYQNVMYVAAGEIIRAVSGQSWDDFLARRVLEPLGMQRTCTRLPDLLRSDNVAQPHAPIRGTVQAVPYRNHDNCGPAASVNTSAHDLAQYARLFLNGGEFAGQRLLRAETLTELWTPHTLMPGNGDPKPFVQHLSGPDTYALGWRLQTYRGHRLVHHSGGVDGMRSLLTLVPEEKLGIVALSNQEARGVVRGVTCTVLDAFFGVAGEVDWTAVFADERRESAARAAKAQQERLSARVTGTRPSLALEAYAGSYRDRMVEDIPVTLEDGHLVLRFSHTPAFTADLEHWHYDTFLLHWRDPYIPDGLATFVLNSRGKPAAIHLDQPNLLDVDFRELEIVRAEG